MCEGGATFTVPITREGLVLDYRTVIREFQGAVLCGGELIVKAPLRDTMPGRRFSFETGQGGR